MKNWKIIVITLLLTVLYVVSVQQALGGLRYLYRVEPQMMAPAEARPAAIKTDSDKHGATRVILTPSDTSQPLYYVLVKESFYDNRPRRPAHPLGAKADRQIIR